MSIKSKYFISLQHSGRRWISNVIGHYDQYQIGNDPSETWINHRNPLRKYGVLDRWDIVPSHCNSGVGKEIGVPRLYPLRPAFIVVRHPAKVIRSVFRHKNEKVEGFNASINEFIDGGILDFIIDYSNKVYVSRVFNNKLILSYDQLLQEQFKDDKPGWTSVIKFFFNEVNPVSLNRAVENNIAGKKDSEVRRYNRAAPSELGKLTAEEAEISEIISPQLRLRLDNRVRDFFIKNNFC